MEIFWKRKTEPNVILEPITYSGPNRKSLGGK